MSTIAFQYYNSPCGKIVLASYEGKLCLCDWQEYPCAERNRRKLQQTLKADWREEPSEVSELAKKQLDEYFAGTRRRFDMPLLMVGTDFQKKVWNALQEIPYGETRSYKDIAQRVDNVQGVRAVAQAIGSNRLSVFIPCHRVIGFNHTLTGFAGGLEAKKTLLQVEHVKYLFGTV